MWQLKSELLEAYVCGLCYARRSYSAESDPFVPKEVQLTNTGTMWSEVELYFL
jgi:hypothetical protein